MTKEVPGRKEGRKERCVVAASEGRACRAMPIMPCHARPGQARQCRAKFNEMDHAKIRSSRRPSVRPARPSRWQDPGNWNGHGTQPLEEKKMMGATFFNVPRLIKQCRLLYGNTYITAPYHRDIIQYEYRESSII